MEEEEKVLLERLYKQLEPIINEVATTHTKNDRIGIEFPVAEVFIDFK